MSYESGFRKGSGGGLAWTVSGGAEIKGAGSRQQNHWQSRQPKWRCRERRRGHCTTCIGAGICVHGKLSIRGGNWWTGYVSNRDMECPDCNSTYTSKSSESYDTRLVLADSSSSLGAAGTWMMMDLSSSSLLSVVGASDCECDMRWWAKRLRLEESREMLWVSSLPTLLLPSLKSTDPRLLRRIDLDLAMSLPSPSVLSAMIARYTWDDSEVRTANFVPGFRSRESEFAPDTSLVGTRSLGSFGRWGLVYK